MPRLRAPARCVGCTHSVMLSFHRIAVPATLAFLVATLTLREPPRSSTAGQARAALVHESHATCAPTHNNAACCLRTGTAGALLRPTRTLDAALKVGAVPHVVFILVLARGLDCCDDQVALGHLRHADRAELSSGDVLLLLGPHTRPVRARIGRANVGDCGACESVVLRTPGCPTSRQTRVKHSRSCVVSECKLAGTGVVQAPSFWPRLLGALWPWPAPPSPSLCQRELLCIAASPRR